jgi:hypothetical protein
MPYLAYRHGTNPAKLFAEWFESIPPFAYWSTGTLDYYVFRDPTDSALDNTDYRYLVTAHKNAASAASTLDLDAPEYRLEPVTILDTFEELQAYCTSTNPTYRERV